MPLWSAGRAEEILRRAEAFASERSRDEQQRALLALALRGLRPQLREMDFPPPFMALLLLVYAAVRGESKPALPLAVATTFLYLGIDILDDLADGDLPRHWKGRKESEINLAAVTLISTLPQLALSELDAPPETIADLQRILAGGLLTMSAGQQRDLATAGATRVSAAEVEASVARKSGEELALFAALASRLAGASAAAVEAYACMGRSLGTAGQLASDFHDLFQARHSSDLANGTRTLPIALHLERPSRTGRRAFLALLDKARQSETARRAVRKRLLAAGELRRCAIIVELHCRRAQAALQRAGAREPARSELAALINASSFFPKRQETAP